MRDSVGMLSSDMTRVASFMGLSALSTSSAHVISDSLNVKISFSLLLTSVESRAAQMAGCCSKNRSIIS